MDRPQDLKDVNPEVTSPSEDAVEDIAPDVQLPEPSVEGQEAKLPSTQEVKPEVEVGDDRPIQNVAWEAKRKSDEALAAIQRVESLLQEKLTPPQQEPKYSKSQLRAFAENTTDQTQKIWALEEIDKLEKSERQSEMRQLFESHTKKTQEDMERQQSLQFVVQNFPDIVYKNPQGNFVGFNQSHPLYNAIDGYMRSNPELARNPRGLIAAAKMAAFDLGVSMNSKLQNKVSQATAQLRKEQKKNLISSGGTQVPTEAPRARISKLAVEYQRTGDPKVFKELAKARGLLPQE